MSYYYNGNQLKNMFVDPTVSSGSNMIGGLYGNSLVQTTSSAYIIESFAPGIISGIGSRYLIGGHPITKYASPPATNYGYTGASVNVTPPVWATKVSIACIGGGGGGGGGGNGFDPSPNQTKKGQNGGGGGGGGSATYTIYRGYPVNSSSQIQVYVGGGGGGGGVNPAGPGQSGQQSSVIISGVNVIQAQGGNPGGAGGNSQGGGAGGGVLYAAANAISAYGSMSYTPVTSGSGQPGQAGSRGGGAGGGLVTPTDYIPINFGNGGSGGGGSNYTDQGDQPGQAGQAGRVRIYWLV